MVRIIALTLTVLCLTFSVSAQNGNGGREKPPSQSPSTGSGVLEGGPSGLFTIYDGTTIRRGEFTYSIAYANFDRDPGDVDIVDIPLSFNVGVNDHLELFFKTTGYRGVKISNFQNLSSFYAPNSRLHLSATTLSVPACNRGSQPFRQLPGIVLAIPASPFNTLVVPDLFTLALAYLPNAPFVNPQYGESGFNTMVRAKAPLTDPYYAFGFGVEPISPLYPPGTFIWDRDVSEQDRERIRLILKQGPEHLKKICALYGADSPNCKHFREAIDSFGQEGVDNGVTVAVGPIQTKGAGAETSVAPCNKWKTTKTKDNPTGQRTTITLTKETVNAADLIHVFRHEGSHVADGTKWRASGCKRSSNPFLFETESKAYTVAGLSAQAHKPNVAYEFLLPGGGRPGKNPFLPETLPIYRPDLKADELQNLRDSSINKLLGRPKYAGGLYEVTPKFPGMRVFGLQH